MKTNRRSFIKNISQGAVAMSVMPGMISTGKEKTAIAPVPEIRIKSKPLHPGDSINGRVILDRSILLTNTIRLTYKENDVSFQFTGMHYANPGKNRFEYKLENFDKEWKETDAESRLAVYTNLPAGSYILKVKACNNDGIWGDTDAELRVIITPPFWDTWWFKIIVVLLIIILVSYYFMNRAIQAERQQKALAHLVDEQTAELKAQAEKLQEYNTELVNTNEELELLTQELRTQSEELFVTNESLMKLNATRDKLFSIIAHDLRNPFQAILSITEMLQKNFRQYNDTEKFTFVQSLVSSSRSAYNLLDDLLEWSRSQSENVPFEPQHFALHDIILPTLKVLGLQAEAKKITITNTVKPFIKAYADKNMALTVFRNILSNAIKFTPEFGCISISATENEPHAEIMITDNGVGMSDETIHQLFRIDKKQLQTGTTGETGSGLGLIICKDFVEKNHGQLLVNSTQGKGSTFTICLPLTSNYFASTARMKDEAAIKLKEENKDQPADSAESTTDTKKYLILLIEDNANIRLSINAAMTDQYLMQEAENGKSGLEKAFDLIPDIIISDVVMPEMDGLELCRSLKNDQRTCHIPIILLTAKSTDTNKIIGLEMGADDYITKPFNMQVLETRVRNLIRNRELLRNRYCMEYNLSPQSVSANATDQKFIDHILELMDKHLSDEKYDVDTFARDLGMSRRQLYRKFAALYGLSVNEFMKDYRLKQAAKMLVEKKLSISEIAFATGFTSLSYFSNLFHKKFGMTPSGFIENNKA